ncbi:MAG TPA: ribbon-helix-helix protein, CopG family [Thermococcus paralvinellae]|uniref:Ribbon-helix-helix protein, CopG family n=1 Tax=Thermococcus paralvinellae TaxID=582419 RepID=A0A833E0F5_9EURY|nr:ribbon-helix-helix protein, CopG family [Thermococcus paralvinellae]HIP89417.1 ribbon-helix-helix protein, CopG family [Thermococcus paralvinellae]
MTKMKIISVQIPQGLLNAIDTLVKRGAYPNRSEAIREAIRELIKKEIYKLETKEGSTPEYILE